MKQYPKYKDSGVSWIGEIPEGWETRRLKFSCNLIQEKTMDSSLPYIALENIESYSGRLLSTNTTIPEGACNLYRTNDVLFSKLRPYLTKCVVAPSEGKCSSELLVLRDFEGENKYLQYLMLSPKYIEYIDSSTYGAKMPRANWQFIGNTSIPLPSDSEQTAIVSFLDKNTSQIDRFIAEAEIEIEKLNELKQAQIAHMVTHGLNPDAPMKDSGIAWIGQIPEHWKVKSLRNYLKLVSDKGHGEEQLLSVTREQGVIVRNVESKEENHNFVPDDLSGYKLVKEGQFAINKMKSWQGSYGVSSYRGIVSPAYYVCDLNYKNKNFFSIAIRSKAYVPFFTQYSKGIRVDQWDLSPIALKQIPFIEPPEDEMSSIVSAINSMNAKIDTLTANLTRQIEHLKELKQRIISDAVTGKIDVREVNN